MPRRATISGMSQEGEQHEIVGLLKDLAISLGRSPRATDLTGVEGLSQYRITRVFGNFSVAMQAAGLDMAKAQKRRKVTSEVFERELEPHLEEQHARQAEPRTSNFILPIENYPTTVVLGDFHAPFHHVEATKFAISVIAELKPKRVVQVGDLRDMFSSGKYPRSHNVFTPREEIGLGTKACNWLWSEVRKASPEAECYQLLGNHDIRPYKRVLEACPELEMFIDLSPLYRFDGVKLIEDSRQELELDGVFFHHGYITRQGGNRDFTNSCFVSGHSHRAGAVYRAIWGGHTIWELNAGTLGDPQSKGLSYTPQRHHHQTLGVSAIDRFGPRFIPYQPKR
jgi:hypothetical protein